MYVVGTNPGETVRSDDMNTDADFNTASVFVD